MKLFVLLENSEMYWGGGGGSIILYSGIKYDCPQMSRQVVL